MKSIPADRSLDKEVTQVKARLFRLGLALANLAMLVAVSGAGNKWR